MGWFLAKPSADLFIENLQMLLRHEGKSAAALARHLKVDRSLITAWTKRKSDPGVDRLGSIAEYFGVPVTDLFRDATDSRSTGITIDIALRMISEVVQKAKKSD